MTRDAFSCAGAVMTGAAIWLSIGAAPATASNRAAGCAMDVLLEEHGMTQDGRMAESMRAGQPNIEAFRQQQAADQAAGRMPPIGE